MRVERPSPFVLLWRMDEREELRAGEVAVEFPAVSDAGLTFIGRIHTPWTDRLTCPRQGTLDGPICRLQLFQPWQAALAEIGQYERLEVLYWLHLSRRDLVLQSPKSDGRTRGTFSLRSPVRPNPIGSCIVKLEKVEADSLLVRGMDCLAGTPLLDIKPDRTLFKPEAPDKAVEDT